MKIVSFFLAVALSMAAVSTAASAATLVKLHAEGTAAGPALAGGLVYTGQPIVVDAIFNLSNGVRTTTATQDTIYNAGTADVSLEVLSGIWGGPFSALGFFNGVSTSGFAVSLMDPDLKYLLTMTVNRSGHQFASLDSPPAGNVCAGANICTGAIVDPNGGTALNNVGITWDTVSFSTQTAVPEPATWALMILGFGGAGAMIRRSRRNYAFA